MECIRDGRRRQPRREDAEGKHTQTLPVIGACMLFACTWYQSPVRTRASSNVVCRLGFPASRECRSTLIDRNDDASTKSRFDTKRNLVSCVYVMEHRKARRRFQTENVLSFHRSARRTPAATINRVFRSGLGSFPDVGPMASASISVLGLPSVNLPYSMFHYRDVRKLTFCFLTYGRGPVTTNHWPCLTCTCVVPTPAV